MGNMTEAEQQLAEVPVDQVLIPDSQRYKCLGNAIYAGVEDGCKQFDKEVVSGVEQ